MKEPAKITKKIFFQKFHYSKSKNLPSRLTIDFVQICQIANFDLEMNEKLLALREFAHPASRS